MFGDPLRVVNGYDSFGNVCGSDNMDMKKHQEAPMEFSGHDVTDYRYISCCYLCHQEIFDEILFLSLSDLFRLWMFI